ncbi:MAG: hypothetical protein ACOCS6_03180 [Desulfosalsimonas sp.]
MRNDRYPGESRRTSGRRPPDQSRGSSGIAKPQIAHCNIPFAAAKQIQGASGQRILGGMKQA